MEAYRRICQNIDCDFEQKSAYVYSIDDLKKIEDELNALERLGAEAEFSKETALPFRIAGAVKFPRQAQFNPLKFAAAITRELNIFEHTRVCELKEGWAVTDKSRINAGKIIVATHFPFLNKHGSYFIKLYQHRSYVIALKNAPEIDGMYVDQAQNGMSFRNYKEYLLIGGGDHRTGKKGGAWQELRSFARRYYPEAEERYFWATQDCMTLDGIPYIGAYSANTTNLYVATGFNKWGMTSSMVAAALLCDMVMQKHNAYEEVFSPSRSILKPQLARKRF